MKKLQTVNWGIIGCGDVTEVKSGPALQQAQGSNLVAVMRRTPGLAEDYARRHAVPKWYDDAQNLIADPQVNAVYIATPPGSHLEYALQTCRAGKPAYVEKPMARNFAECQEMVRAFKTADLPLFVAYYRRGLPRFVKARELIQTDRLGKITSLAYHCCSPSHRKLHPQNLPWRLQVAQSGGGFFLDLGSHTLDIIDFMVGPLSEVHGAAANLAGLYDAEDVVVMHFQTASGALGTASWNFAAAAKQDMIEITGTHGRLSLSTFGQESVRLETEQGPEEFDLPNPPHIQQPLIQTVVDELLGSGQSPSTGLSASRTSAVMDTVLENYYGSRDDGFWNKPHTWPGRPLE